jgi:hypothetical protein
MTAALPLHERTHNDAFDFDGPADCVYVDAFDSRDEYYGYGPCTCGYRAAMAEADAYDYEPPGRECFNGCGGCDPVMHDCCPYGLGLELWEYAPRMDARAAMRAQWRGGPYCRLPVPHCDVDAAGDAATPERVRKLAKAASRKWQAIVGRAETHTQAVAEYKRWASRISK